MLSTSITTLIHMNTVQQALCSHKAAQNFKGQAAGMFHPHRYETVKHNIVGTQVMNHVQTLEVMPSLTGSIVTIAKGTVA